MPADRLRVALIDAGSDGWIAGRVYTENLARALLLLPEAERPQVWLLSRVRTPLLVEGAGTRRYSFRQGSRPPRREASAGDRAPLGMQG